MSSEVIGLQIASITIVAFLIYFFGLWIVFGLIPLIIVNRWIGKTQ